MNLLYHGRNRKQCYKRPNCLICGLKAIVDVAVLFITYTWGDHRRDR